MPEKMNFEEPLPGFSVAENYAIQEKYNLLKKVKDGRLTKQEARDLITRRRVKWFKDNGSEALEKYDGLPDHEKACRIIVYDHMKIKQDENSRIELVTNDFLILYSANFCPYLEACKLLGMDTVEVCRDIGEQSIQALAQLVNPMIVFGRDYDHLRPNKDFCWEYFMLR